MEIMMDLPSYMGNGGVRQRFKIISGDLKWKGEAEFAKPININVNKMRKLIEQSIRDAKRGYTYRCVGRMSKEYKYLVNLEKDDEEYFANISRIEIYITDNSGEKMAKIKINFDKLS